MIYFYLCVALLGAVSGDNLNLRARQSVDAVHSGHRFTGNRTADGDNFKLLATDGDSLLVGARNAVYNLSLSQLDLNHEISWHPAAADVEGCTMKGKTRDECQNYVRVLARLPQRRLLVCGTHAFSPLCRVYAQGTDGVVRSERQFSGQALCPFDPRDNSTAVYASSSDVLYSGTVSDFAGSDPLIYRRGLGPDSGDGLRTQKDDVRVLDVPNFVNSFQYKEHIYFFFREKAAEVMDNNEERQVYARVARVCASDKGGPRPAHEKWTTYMKARLNCSIPGTAPFYFNELKAVSEPVPSSGGDHLVYGVFSTPESAVRMSAVCAFSMKKIREEFDHGLFKYQKTSSSLWGPFARNDLPKPRPGSCSRDSTKLPEATISFILRNPLLHRPIDSVSGPMVVEGSDRPDLTQIAVMSQVKSVENRKYDVVFLGTSDGRMLKAIKEDDNTTVIETVRVFQKGTPVVNLITSEQQVVVVSPSEVAALPVHRCGQQTSCSGCVFLQDPHCAWNTNTARCEHSASWSSGDFVQNIVYGYSEQCPEGINPAAYMIDDPAMERVSSEPRQGAVYSAQNMLLACLVCLAVASAIGFLIGYRVSRSRSLNEQHRSASSTSGSDYDSFGRARLTRHDSLTAGGGKMDVYGHPMKHSMDAASIMMGVPGMMNMSSAASQHGGNMSVSMGPGIGMMGMSGASQSASGATTPSRDRNAVLTSLHQQTLPRDYKVKKVYL